MESSYGGFKERRRRENWIEGNRKVDEGKGEDGKPQSKIRVSKA